MIKSVNTDSLLRIEALDQRMARHRRMMVAFNNALTPVETADSQAILQDTPNQMNLDHI